MSPAPPSNARIWIALIGILLVTLGVFWHSLGGEFVYDDRLMIERNPRVAEARWEELLTKPYWDFLRPEDSSQIGYWRPLTATVLTLAYAVGDGSPGTFHATCLFVHLAATVAAFLLVRRLTRRPWIAAGAALLFGLHPLHVESVAWISAINDPLFGLFALLTLERFLAWRDGGSRGAPIAAALMLAVGLFAKELAAAVLPLLVALDYARRRSANEPDSTTFPRALHAYLPFAVVVGAYLVLRMAVFGSFWAGFDRTTTDFAVSTSRLLLLRAEILGGATDLLLWPSKLQLFRPFRPVIALDDPALLRAFFAIALLTAGMAAAWLKRSRVLLFALVIIPAGLLPALIRVESLGRFPLSDRFLYLPVLGVSLAIVLIAARLPRRLGLALVLIVALAYGAKSWEQSSIWQNEENLFRHATANAPRSVYAKWGLGRVLLDTYQKDSDIQTLREADSVFEEAKDLLIEAKFDKQTDLFVTSRDYLQVNLGSGWCLLYRAEFDPSQARLATGIWEELARVIEKVEAEESEARELGIRVRSANLELELVYTALGAGYMQAHLLDEAVQVLQKALDLDPFNPEAAQNLGRTYAKLDDWELARNFFRQALAQRPGSVEDRLLIAQASLELGDVEEAETIARELVEKAPEQAQAHLLLATIHMQRGDGTGAQPWIEEALRIDPKNGHAWYLRGNNFLARQMIPEALAALRRSAELQPDSFEAFYQYGALLLQVGAGIQESLPVLMQAYTLAERPDALTALGATLKDLVAGEIRPIIDLARIDQARRFFDASDGWVEQALAIDPSNGDALFLCGQFLVNRGQVAEALSWLQKAQEQLPDSYDVNYQLGLALERLDQKEAARVAFEHARDLGPPAHWEADLREFALASLNRRIDDLSQ